jgi:hypothetical protein
LTNGSGACKKNVEVEPVGDFNWPRPKLFFKNGIEDFYAVGSVQSDTLPTPIPSLGIDQADFAHHFNNLLLLGIKDDRKPK